MRKKPGTFELVQRISEGSRDHFVTRKYGVYDNDHRG